MTQFEDDADATQIMKRRTWIDFRIYDRDAIRQRRFRLACQAVALRRLVMIEHNHVHAAPLKIDNLIYRRSPAVDRDQKLRLKLLETPINTFAAQAVTFLHPQRQK